MGSFESHPLFGAHCGGQLIPLATIAAGAFVGAATRWLHRLSTPGGVLSHICATADLLRLHTFHRTRRRYGEHLPVDRNGVIV